MKYEIRSLLTLLGCFLFIAAFTQELEWTKPEEVGLSAARLDRVNDKMQTYIDGKKLGGIATMIARKGRVVQCETFGYQNIEKGQPVDKNSIFRIYSMSKPITAVALMILYEEGKFQLNDKISDHIPELKDLKVYEEGELVEVRNPMTIKHLLTHTSGLSYGWGSSHVDTLYAMANIWQPGIDLQEFTRRIGSLPLHFQPGTKYMYGVSIDILGYLVEVLSSQTFDVFLQQRIFEPLGMEDTGFYVPAEKHSRFMEGYRPNRNGGIEIIGDPFFTAGFKSPATLYSGGGGLVSTLSDYMRIAQMLLNRGELDGVRILSRKTVELMTMDHLPKSVEYKWGYGYGFAMEVLEEVAPGSNLGSAGEYRWSGMANTHFWIDPREELIGMVFTQFLPYGFYPIDQEFKTLVYQAIVD